MIDKEKHNLFSVRNLNVGYQNKLGVEEVIREFSANLNAGKLVAILGKNGSGKSTLIRSLTRTQPLLSGEVFIMDKDINQYNQIELAKNIAVVLTEKIPDSLLTVRELVASGRHAYTNWMDRLTVEDKEKINFSIVQTKIDNLLDKKFNELSDGQKQKVLIARAITQDTPIIFLDEPTAHLDVHHRMESFLLLKKLAHEQEKLIIIATHEIGLSIQLADELWLTHDKSIEIGTPEACITKKSIEKIFNSDLISFNPKKTTFEYK